eukprot:5211952-Prymnesium_polylepis.1
MPREPPVMKSVLPASDGSVAAGMTTCAGVTGAFEGLGIAVGAENAEKKRSYAAGSPTKKSGISGESESAGCVLAVPARWRYSWRALAGRPSLSASVMMSSSTK